MRLQPEDIVRSVDWTLARELESASLLTCRDHPELPLHVLNYAPKCQYERAWTPFLLQCRGLVVDDTGAVCGRSFPKFFNDMEFDEPIPWHLSHEITEKVDGSLIVAFDYDGRRVLTTRGSFVSDQAAEAERIWSAIYPGAALRGGLSYLFEVIYPENRIVVDYGERRDLVLLGLLETATGVERPLASAGERWHLVRTIHALASSADELRSLVAEAEEGYVVHFPGWGRVKVKGYEYLRIHALITGTSTRTVWECLRDGRPIDELLDRVPDEFARWVLSAAETMRARFAERASAIEAAWTDVRDLPDRKTQAARIMQRHKPLAHAVFARIDGKSTDEWIWKQLYPKAHAPYSPDDQAPA